MPDLTRRTIAAYDCHAAAYAAINASTTPIQHLLAIFRRLVPAGRILDVGCGPGRDSAYFASHGYTVTGVDLSRGQLAIAARQAPAADFALADMRRLPFPAARFDGLWVCASLLHLPREQAPAILADFRRLLKADGVLYVGVKTGEGERWVGGLHFEGTERFFVYYEPEEIADLIAEAGFAIMTVHADDKWVNIFAQVAG